MKRLTVLIVCAVLVMTAMMWKPAQPDACTVCDVYGSIPKGVTLESVAEGVAPFKEILYDAETNTFVIDDLVKYPLPIEGEMVCELIEAIAKDDRIGVSLNFSKNLIITYGALSSKATVAKELLGADKLLGCASFGWRHLDPDAKFPQNYEPKKVSDGYRTVGYSNLTNFRFEQKGKVYSLADFDLNVIVIPVLTKKAKDGGFLPDEKALERNDYLTSAHRANLAHIELFKKEYKALPPVKKAGDIGAVCAFLRYTKDKARINMKELLGEMRQELKKAAKSRKKAEKAKAKAEAAAKKAEAAKAKEDAKKEAATNEEKAEAKESDK